MDQMQFYPTPPDLARRAWAKFEDQDFVRVLEPHAGNGDLATAHPKNQDNHTHRHILPDCCEIDIARHATLHEKHLNVVGMDFLKFKPGAIYSHIVMNPPFNEGVKHVLHAWEIIWDGEIVAIINAETVRNPFSAERKLLASIIDRYGEVEFIENAFAVTEAERKTSVEVALVYLRKEANVSEDIVGPMLDEMKRDGVTSDILADGYHEMHEVAIPNSVIENSVIAFNAAVKVMREAVFAEARSGYYARLLGDTLATMNGEMDGNMSTRRDSSVDFVKNVTGKRYDELKDRAWAGILRSAKVTSKLSSAAQKRVESEFEKIKQLEFTVEAIYGFLCGIIDSQGQIQIQMCCDVFDLFSRYHDDNTVFFKGWKSNSKHRTCGMRLKTTRVVLPGHKTDNHQSNLDWDSRQMLKDFDKVFAMLDGKAEVHDGLEYAFNHHFKELRAGKRIPSAYFDVRYYRGIGNIHLFPKSKNLIDRLNRLVGRERAWLPPECSPVSDAFWQQFDDAEKFDKEVRAEVGKTHSSGWRDPFWMATCKDHEDQAKAGQIIDEALTTVLEQHGINVDFQLGCQPEMKLLAA